MPVLFGFLLAVIIVAIYARRNRGRRHCRWRESRTGSRGALVKYNCVNCGAEAFAATGKPKRCMAKVKTPDQ